MGELLTIKNSNKIGSFKEKAAEMGPQKAA